MSLNKSLATGGKGRKHGCIEYHRSYNKKGQKEKNV